VLLRIAGIVFPVFAVAGIGWLYAGWKRPDLTVVNDLNMDVLAPWLVFWALTAKPFSAVEFLDLSLGGAAVTLGSGLLLLPVIPLLKVQLKTFLPPMMFINAKSNIRIVGGCCWLRCTVGCQGDHNKARILRASSKPLLNQYSLGSIITLSVK
jgi:predicted permease